MTDYLKDTWDLQDKELVSVIDEVTLWSASFGLFLLDFVPLKKNMNVLDVACGPGFPLLEMAQRLGPTCSVTGIDIWEEGIELSNKKIKVKKVRNARAIHYDGITIPFENDSFDLIVSNLGINNFENPEVVCKECFRVTKPGGVFALTTNPVGHMKEFYDVFEKTLQELDLTSHLTDLEKNIAHRLTYRIVSNMLEKCGFTIERSLTKDYTIRFTDGSAMLNDYFMKIGFMEGWKNVVTPMDEERLFETLEANLNAHAGEKGGLTLTVPMLYVEAVKSA